MINLRLSDYFNIFEQKSINIIRCVYNNKKIINNVDRKFGKYYQKLLIDIKFFIACHYRLITTLRQIMLLIIYAITIAIFFDVILIIWWVKTFLFIKMILVIISLIIISNILVKLILSWLKK